MTHTFSSVFDQPDERKIGRAFAASLGLHGAVLALVAWWMFAPPVAVQTPPDLTKLVFLEAPGPGGGGGGSPTPAPPRKIEIPKSEPRPTPVAPQPVPVVVTPPPPELVAPVRTNITDLLQSTGVSALLSPPAPGGAGRGKGNGPGDGDGVGPGKDKGFGDGAFQPGNGVEDPTLIKPVQPKYTSDAMRAKIQGVVLLDAVVLPNGTVGDVRVAKSLDRSFGLDEKAIEAARGWLFRPGMRPDPVTKQRVPVAVMVRLELEFRLH